MGYAKEKQDGQQQPATLNEARHNRFERVWKYIKDNYNFAEFSVKVPNHSFLVSGCFSARPGGAGTASRKGQYTLQYQFFF
jgi:hypothetical protein